MVTIVVPNHAEPMIDETLVGLRTLGCPIVVSNDPEGRGIGWALRQGLQDVETDWVLFAMADGSEDRDCLRQIIQTTHLTLLPAVWGDRWRLGRVEGYPAWKRLLNRLGNRLVAILSGRRIAYTDWTDLAKAYKTDRLRQIAWSDDFRAEVEMPLRFHRAFFGRGQAPRIVPMIWRERHAGTSAYRLSHALSCLLALGKVVLRG